MRYYETRAETSLISLGSSTGDRDPRGGLPKIITEERTRFPVPGHCLRRIHRESCHYKKIIFRSGAANMNKNYVYLLAVYIDPRRTLMDVMVGMKYHELP